MPIEFKINWKKCFEKGFFKVRDPETKTEVDLGCAYEIKLHCDADGNNFLCIKFPLTAVNFESKGQILAKR